MYFAQIGGDKLNKYKKLAANTLIFSLGSFSSKILSVLLLKLYTSTMTTSDFSVANKIQTIINLLGPVVTLSISEGILRYGLKKELKKEKVYSTGVFTGLAGLAAGMIVVWIVALVAGFKSYMTLMMLFLFTSEFRWMQQQYCKAKNCIKLYTVDSILSTFSLVIFSLLFMAVFKLGITGYIISIVLSDLTSILFLMYFAGMFRDLRSQNVDTEIRKQMIRYSIPLIPTSVLWWIVSSSDLFMVSKFLGEEVNGLYTVAYRIPALISFAAVIFFRAWQMSAISEFGTKECANYYTKVFDSYVSLMFLASAGIMLFLELMTRLLTHEEFWGSFRYAPFLVVAALMQSFCNFLSGIYNAAGKNQKSLSTSALAAGVNIVLNLILIPFVGVQGAAFATMAAYFVCFAVRLTDTQNIAGYIIDWKKLGINVCLLMIMAIIILAGAPLMYLWLFAGFAAVCAVNFRSIVQTAFKLLKRG